MLTIQNLTITLQKTGRELVSDLHFTIAPGDRAALIGEEGNGKSTLLRAIAGDFASSDEIEISGEILTGGQRIGFLRQEPTEEELRLPVCDYLIPDGIRDYALVESLRQKLGIPAGILEETRPLRSFSGGEKVKIALYRLLLTEPDILLLDEPSNDLDLETLQWLEGFLLSLRQPVLFVSHDETLLERCATLIIHLEQLRRKTVPRHTVARLSYREYALSREDAFLKQEAVAKGERLQEKRQQERWQELYQNVHQEQQSVSRQNPHGGKMLKRKMKAVKSMERRFEREAEHQTPFPEYEEAILPRFPLPTPFPAGKEVLRLRLPVLTVGDRVLARDIALDVTGREHIGIVGPNGCGKTTLMRHIRREIEASGLPFQMMPQQYDEAFSKDETPVTFLCPAGDKEGVTSARTLLGGMRFTPKEMLEPIRALSSGQQAKLLLVRLLLTGPPLLLLDEPTRNISPLSGPVIRRLLRDYPGAIISVSHDRKYLDEVCSKVLRLGADGLREMA